MTLSDSQLDELIAAIGLRQPPGGGHRKPIAHGTYRGAKQHRYRKEPLCERCRLADNAYQQQRYAAQRKERV
ncbi:hypothetical protein [Streptomyces sp. A1136]|uniref:hypothetical protein n=1 Tax=Streptomyces sp. A1136 TaxID=2563102 RepID=UPI00109EA4DB|nr:hypothetical protein [Streptomyces sp. A1136]THA56137.1 hypothetical protein E6R62_12395 [Streptomyces sp. A1136]